MSPKNNNHKTIVSVMDLNCRSSYSRSFLLQATSMLKIGSLARHINTAVLCILLQLTAVSLLEAQAGPSQLSNAAGHASSTEQQEQITLEALEGFLLDNAASFTYKREGRPDPFMPFITQEMIQAETETAQEALTGMRQFEPGQLSLVAVMFTDRGPLAMVQDSIGKGYVLRKGTKIGRAGEVVNIVQNKVVIQEPTYSISRQKRFKTVEMVLKKEGDK